MSGVAAGYARKKVMKIAAIVIGLFIVGLSYLSYKGLIDVKRNGECYKSSLANVAG